MARLTWARQIAAITLIVWKIMPTPRLCLLLRGNSDWEEHYAARGIGKKGVRFDGQHRKPQAAGASRAPSPLPPGEHWGR